MRQQLTAAFAALLVALPAFAGGTPQSGKNDFDLPEGCEAFLTVQNRNCSVTLMWRCNVAPQGDIWGASFSDYGLESISNYAASYQWLDTVYTWDQSREQFTPPAADPIELNRLLDTGSDSYDFIMRRSLLEESYDIHITGSDHLTGETEVIDGVELDKVATEMLITADDGTVEYQSHGFQYFSRELGQFFLGIANVIGGDGSSTQYNDSPMDFILPGEPGFGATTPLYECSGGAA